jgi:hypothetical protein
MFEFDPKFGWGTVVQFVGFAVAILVMWYQLQKQREMQKENHLTQIRRDIYKEITDRMEHSSPSGISVTLDLLLGLLAKAREKKEQTGNYLPPPMRVETIANDFKRVQSRLFGVSGAVEKYEIVGENQPLFRRALVAKISEMSNAFMPILFVLPYVLLSDEGITDPDKLLVVADDELGEFKKKIKQFQNVASDVDGFLYDIQVEAQNILLGGLFERKLEVRRPLDPEAMVLTSQDTKQLAKIRAFVQKSEQAEGHDT